MSGCFSSARNVVCAPLCSKILGFGVFLTVYVFRDVSSKTSTFANVLENRRSEIIVKIDARGDFYVFWSFSDRFVSVMLLRNVSSVLRLSKFFYDIRDRLSRAYFCGMSRLFLWFLWIFDARFKAFESDSFFEMSRLVCEIFDACWWRACYFCGMSRLFLLFRPARFFAGRLFLRDVSCVSAFFVGALFFKTYIFAECLVCFAFFSSPCSLRFVIFCGMSRLFRLLLLCFMRASF